MCRGAFLAATGGMHDGVKTSENGCAVLGFTVLAGWVSILICKRNRVSATLPGNHQVCIVSNSSWLRIPLCGFDRTKVSRDEMRNLNTMTEYAIDGVHFYCETLDVSCPFPGKSSSGYNTEFVWNEWLSLPFWNQGLSHYCPKLFQGFAESRDMKDSEGVAYTYAHFCRRSRLHPGTRYLARGINSGASCGNEIECELLIWRRNQGQGKGEGEGAEGQELPFTSYVWRRGSVPIWWGVDIKNTVGEAAIWVKQDDSYHHTARYFRRLRRQYVPEKPERQYSVTCVNLLRCAPGRSELTLSEGFQKGVRSANKMIQNMDLRVLNFDWHANTKALGETGTIKGLWMSIRSMLKEVGFNSGAFKCAPGGSGANSSACAFGFRFDQKQQGVLRYNCADSLDRTNVATFFGLVPVLMEQCNKLGLDLVKKDLPEGVEMSLPRGWEARKDQVTGKTFYIDHNTKTTTWECPFDATLVKDAREMAAEPWWVLDMEVMDVRDNISTELLSTLMEQFKVEGDMNAMLYTGSRAMHSAILQQILPEPMQKKSGSTSSTANNALLSVKRRYLNLVHDGHRQQQMEMFLGINAARFFPSLSYFAPCEYNSDKAHPDSDVEDGDNAAGSSQNNNSNKNAGGSGAADAAASDLLGMELKETVNFQSSKSLDDSVTEENLIDFDSPITT